MESTTRQADIGDIEEQFDRLRGDVADLSAVIRRVAESKTAEARDAALDEAQKLLEKSRRTLDDGAARARGAATSIEDYIHEKPVQASFIALGVGLLIGLMSRR